MTRLTVFFASVLVLVLALPTAAPAQTGPPPSASIKAKPDPSRVGDTVRLVGRRWLTGTAAGGTCARRVKLAIEEPGKRPVKIGAGRVTSTGGFVFSWRVRDFIGNRAQTHGRLLGLKINGRQVCYEGGRKIVIGQSGEMTTIGSSINTPLHWSVGDTLRVTGRDWAGRKNCERRVRLSLRRPGATVKLGRARVRSNRRFAHSRVIEEGVEPADNWKLVAVQRCEDRRLRFAIKRHTQVRIGEAPGSPPEGTSPTQY